MISRLRNYTTKAFPISNIFRCSSLSHLPNQLRTSPLNRIGSKQQICFRKPNKQIFMSLSYKFTTSNNKGDNYQKSGQQIDGKDNDNSLISQNKQSALRFILRLKEYSNFLANEKSLNQSTLVSVNKMQDQMVEKINSHFKQAGTSTKQISDSLKDIAGRLQSMLNENQNLSIRYHQQKDIKNQQKYKNRYEQFIKVLKRLNQQFYKQPPITKVQPIQVALFLLDLQTQLTSMIQLLYGAIQQTSPYFKFTPDITNDDPFSKKFKYAWDKVKIIELDSVTKASHDLVYGLLKKSVIMVTNAVVTQHTLTDWNNQYWHKILFGLSFPVSLVNLQKAQLKCYKLWRRPNIQMVKNLLDLPQKGYIQHAKKIIYPSIKSNFFLYNHSAPKSTVQNKESVKPNQVTAQQTSHNIFQKTQNSGRILLLSNQNLNWKGSKPAEKFGLSSITNLFSRQKAQKVQTAQQKQTETVIIHIHGGGFISMSSQLMQNHTRKWANELKVPVFSLDYRKPPKHRFPEPLQDCVGGYKFIVEKIHEHVNIRPKNIIIAGDSAGGNMACALQAQLMKQKYPLLPKALFLMYPAVDLRIRYTASRLHSFSDGIFLPSLLMLCQQEYLGKDRKNQFDPLASPILLTESYINPEKKGTPQSEKWPQAWPKTVILAGRKDPLFDDSIRLLERLTRDGLDCKMLLYKDFSHGFMSMDQALPGCKQAINDSISELKQIISSFESGKKQQNR